MTDFVASLDQAFGLDWLITLLATGTAVLTLLLAWATVVPKTSTAARARALRARRQAMQAEAQEQKSKAGRLAQMRAHGVMTEVVKRLDLLRSSQADKIRLTLARAGWRNQQALITYLFAKLVAPISFGLLAVVLFYGIGFLGLSDLMRLLAALVFTLIGAYAPDLFVKNQAQKRTDAIRKSLPDGLDMLVICSEAGLSMDAAFNRVSHEMGDALPELSDEFGLTALELGFLPDRRKALMNLSARVDLEGMRALINTLIQTEQYGTPLSQALRSLAAELRTERMLRAEEKAARLPATMTVPMVLFILPPLVIVLLGPAILNTIDSLAGM